jgi:hypothetical protein
MKSTSARLCWQRRKAPELIAGFWCLSCEKMWARSGLLCVCLVVVHAVAWGQAYDPLDLLHLVSANVTGKLGPSGAYRCSLTLERTQFLSEDDGKPACDGRIRLIESDRAKLDVAIAAGKENYFWPGENRLLSEDFYDFASLGMQTGNYSEFLSAIFGSDAADFYWMGETEADGRKLGEFSFKVPIERSRHVFQCGKGRYDATYSGTFLADPATGDLVRLTVRTDGLPAESGVCQAATTLEYGRGVLPDSAKAEISYSNGIEARNRVAYTDCRLSAEPHSTMTVPGKALPAGLKFRIRLEQTIDPEKDLGGDRIKAVLETPILEKSSTEVLVPEGAQIIARIIRLEHFPDTKGLGLEFRLEEVEKKGEMIPLRAVAGELPVPTLVVSPADLKRLPRGGGVGFSHPEATPVPPPGKAGVPFLTGHFQDDPRIYVLQFGPVKPGFVIKAGIKTNWVTAGP